MSVEAIKRKRGPATGVICGGLVRPSLTELWQDSERARITWSSYYHSLPKYGRTTAQAYKENGLWRRWKNREKKYELAYENYRSAAPTA